MSLGSSDVASLLSLQVRDQVQDHFEAGTGGPGVVLSPPPAGKEWTPLPGCLPNRGLWSKISSWSPASKTTGWLEIWAGQGSMAPSFPRASNLSHPCLEGVACDICGNHKRHPSPPWTKLHSYILWLSSEYGGDQTGFRGAFVTFPKQTAVGKDLNNKPFKSILKWSYHVMGDCVVPSLHSDLGMTRSLHPAGLGRSLWMCFTFFFLSRRTVCGQRKETEREREAGGVEGQRLWRECYAVRRRETHTACWEETSELHPHSPTSAKSSYH